ncbi:smalltalk protein [Bacteroides rodentium]
MNTKSSVWDKILKVIIAVASALIGALSAHAMPL